MELSVLSYDLHLQMESALSGTRTIVQIFFGALSVHVDLKN